MKKPIHKKWWFWVLIVILLGIIGAQLGGKEEKTVSGPSSSTAGAKTATDGSSPSPEASKEPEEIAITKPGETITTKNFKLTVEALNKLSGSDFVKPTDGNEFVQVVVLIENISKKDYMVSSALMFDAYQDDFSINQDFMALTLDNKLSTLDGELAAGKKLRGQLAYEVPKDWKQLEINVDLTKLSFSNDGEIKIKLPNEK
ncbi:DUF4352 domain-containing protein [Gorillibacterium sp. CAU 1737]|uniref:DUF4352 domain-containing protein n=1 Tax=Gorillibacterium sp. CAU 1737 TaxID=3140362 RepID=UPI0032604AC5